MNDPINILKRIALAPVPDDRELRLGDELCIARIDALHYLLEHGIIKEKRDHE